MIWRGSLNQMTQSLVAQITVLTAGALFLVTVLVAILGQLIFVHWLFPSVMAENANSAAELVWLIESAPDDLEPFILSAFNGASRVAAVADDFDRKARANEHLRAQLRTGDTDALTRLDGRDIRYRPMTFLNLRGGLPNNLHRDLNALSALQLSIGMDDGRVLSIWLAPSVHLSKRPVQYALFVWVVVVLAVALSIAVAYIALRPIRQLESDAQRVGLAETGAGLSETGPIELRRVARAFNTMRGRLGGLIREREQIVAAIAHDIRTALTRVRLRFEGADALPVSALERDLAQMETLIADMLAYARAESPAGPRELVQLEAFVADLVAETPTPVAFQRHGAAEGFTIAGDPVALRRLFENLLENARRYGAGAIWVRAEEVEDGLQIRVEDDGPGLPEHELETVFEPFHRREGSRNRDSGGTGLGLGIARAIARAHGAALHLENRPQGGLAAVVHFPAAMRT